MRITADIIDEEGGTTCRPACAQRTKIFVEKLPDDYTVDDLRDLFSKYGEVTECYMINRTGFVHMATAAQAEKAVKNLNNYNLNSPDDISKEVSPLYVKLCQQFQFGADMKEHVAEPKMTKLFVLNLPKSCTEDDLRNLFSNYGEVIDPHVYCLSYSTERKAGYLFMATVEQAEEAKKYLHNHNFKGSKISVMLGRTFQGEVVGEWKAEPFRDMCSKFRNLNISSSELNETYPTFEGIAAAVPENKVMIKDLPPGCNFGRLNELFSKYGTVIECRFVRESTAAILTMKTPIEAESAIKHLNGVNFLGSKIGVMPFLIPDIRSVTDKLFYEKCKPEMEEIIRNRKMNEAKASSSMSGKGDGETPSPWMMQFLLKMKQEIKDEILEELTNVPRIEVQGHSTANGKGDENQYQGEVVHPNIYCDNCDQLIHGIRYKCGNCTDFDLCQECESLPNIHDKNHIFLKIRNPLSLKLFQKQKWTPLVLPPANEPLIIPSCKSHSSKKLYEAKFVCDETVPDGTIIAPSTQFVKSWRVLNSGKRVWTHSTKLQHIQGSIGLTPASELVDVPHLRPGEEGVVSVLFTTPSIPGVYRSHWNFCHKSRPFGHIVWCHIVVKEPETEEKQAEAAAPAVNLPIKKSPSEKEKEVASIAKVLTAVKEEHEKGNMIPRKLAVNSHTATPNNTPFDLTPPKSPDHQVVNELKVVIEDKESVSSFTIEECDHDDEGSVVSLSSSESDAEFVVIPMPNCFNLSESFASHSHLSQYLQSENVVDQNISRPSQKSAKPQNIVLKPPIFNTETVSQETGVPELSEHSPSHSEDGEQKILISHSVSGDNSSSEISIIESGESSPTALNAMPEISSIHIAVTNDAGSKVGEEVVVERRNSVQQETPEREEQATDIPCSSATFPKFPIEGITSIYEPASSNTEERTVQVLPESIVTVPLNVASTVYNATMQVMTNLRRHAQNTEGATGTSRRSLQPMEQLKEMGFCNTQQNEELLRKHKNDVALVVAELVSLNDNDWYTSRHVPPSAPTFD